MAAKITICNELDISSSWTIQCDNKELKGSVTINTSNESVQLDDVVQLETCVHLVQQNKEPCTIRICIPESSSEFIEQLVVVSEARIVELYGNCEEYLSTCTAEYVDDFDDCAVYMAECKTKPTQELLIKFQKTKYPDRLWLYGINLTISPIKSALSPLSSINFQAVNDMLKDTKVPLSENAEKCKNFLQTHFSASNHNQQMPFDKLTFSKSLMKMLETEHYNPRNKIDRNVSKCFSNFELSLPQGSSESDPVMVSGGGDPNGRPDTSLNRNVTSSECQLLKSYIEKRFSDLESKMERFENNLRQLEMRQNEKLDCIIALLSKQNS